MIFRRPLSSLVLLYAGIIKNPIESEDITEDATASGAHAAISFC